MPQIGWFEILIIVFLAILIIGPKDFPIMLKKIGQWFGTFKKYINDIQSNVDNLTEINPINEEENQDLKEKNKKDDK